MTNSGSATLNWQLGEVLSYQWQHENTNLAGGASNVLTLNNVSSADAGSYTVQVTNAFGIVTTTGAVLSVMPFTAPGVLLETLYSFSDGEDGANPNQLVQTADGNF